MHILSRKDFHYNPKHQKVYSSITKGCLAITNKFIISNRENIMNNQFNNYQTGTAYMPAVEKVIKPNMEEYAQKLSIYRTLTYIGVVACFMGFGALGFRMVSSFEFGFSPIIFIPFLGFGGFGVLAGLLQTRARMAQAIVSVMNQIKSTDKVEIGDISYTFKNFSGDVLHIIRLLISTNNLNGYQIIDNRIVAKDGITITTKEETNAQTYACSDCGAMLKGSDIYCPKCGKRR